MRARRSSSTASQTRYSATSGSYKAAPPGLESLHRPTAWGRRPRIGIARSENHSNTYELVNEEVRARGLTDGVINQQIHADMVFFETQSGGAAFSVGSIAYAGSFGHRVSIAIARLRLECPAPVRESRTIRAAASLTESARRQFRKILFEIHFMLLAPASRALPPPGAAATDLPRDRLRQLGKLQAPDPRTAPASPQVEGRAPLHDRACCSLSA